MTPSEGALIVYFLDELSDVLSNRGCNDFDLKSLIPDEDERILFVKDYHEYNGDPEEFDPGRLELPDFAVLALVADKLRQELGLGNR